jgi:CheY-like chemotaxis protein
MAGELVLLVDDEPNIIQLLRMYLVRDGFRVEAVGDGQAALDTINKLQQNSPVPYLTILY